MKRLNNSHLHCWSELKWMPEIFPTAFVKAIWSYWRYFISWLQLQGIKTGSSVTCWLVLNRTHGTSLFWPKPRRLFKGRTALNSANQHRIPENLSPLLTVRGRDNQKARSILHERDLDFWKVRWLTKGTELNNISHWLCRSGFQSSMKLQH